MSRSQEFLDVMEHMQLAWDRGQKTALLMVASVRGSAYRQPGTKMMMAQDGQMFGTISGGCLESDLFAWAETAMRTQAPLVHSYDLSASEIWSLGIGCKGALDIFIQPVGQEDAFWQTARQMARKGRTVSLVMEMPAGAKVLLAQNGECYGDAGLLPDVVRRQALAGLLHQTRAVVSEAEGRWFVIDTLRPSERLIIAGAGQDAQPVAELAVKAGFSVTILDSREYWNNERRFPRAAHLVSDASALLPERLPDSWWIIMNHQVERDQSALRLALQSKPRYVGVLGPLARTEELLAAIGCTLASGPIHSPVGLDLGAETMDEVAISMVAQLLSVRNQRTAASLHGKAKIHV